MDFTAYFPVRNKVHRGMLLLMLIPGQVLLVPNYLLQA